MIKITIKINAKKVIVVDSNDGGSYSGHCSACGARGWIDNCGYPHRVKAPGSHLQHKAKCPMNKVLNDDGSLKK